MKNFLFVLFTLLLSVFIVVEFFKEPSPPPDDLLALHHRGVALIYQHQFTEAEQVLEELVQLVPKDPVPWFNLGVAQLNQADVGVDRALESLARAARLDPDNPRVPYCQGVIHRFKGSAEEALVGFQRALELVKGVGLHSEIADVEYYCGMCLKQLGELDRALGHLEAAVTANPHIIGAWHNLQLEWRRLGRIADADRALARLQVLRETKRGETRATTFTEMGALSEPITEWRSDAIPEDPIEVSFEAPFRLTERSGPFAFVDHDLDCIPDLWCGGRAAGVWELHGDAPERVEDLSALHEATSFAVGDFSEDGVADLVVSTPRGIFTAVATGEARRFHAAEELAGPKGTRVWLVDLDLEADLDLLVSGGGLPAVAINRGRGFAPFDPSVPNLGELPPGATVRLVRDLDGDGDAELLLDVGDRVVLIDNAPQWRFSPNPPQRRVEIGGDLRFVEAGDVDGDGHDDLLVGGSRSGIYRNDGNGNFPGPPRLPEALTGALALDLLDADLDGFLDIIVGGKDRSSLWRNLGNDLRFERTSVELPPMTAIASADVDDDLDPDLVYRGLGGSLWLRKNLVSGPHRALRLYLGGQRDAEDRHTNHLGLGARVEVHAGNLTCRVTNDGDVGQNAQGIVPIIVGIGPRSKVDSIIIRWPDRVIQSETDVPLDVCHPIEQVQRKASSCPILFTWDGTKYRFITDFMGGGGLGFWVGMNEYGAPDPTETIRIPPDALRPIQGEYRLSVMEPMEEVAYIDHLRLRAVSHPAGVDVYPDELFSTGGLQPTGNALAVERRARVFPVAARDADGQDVRDPLLRVDRIYVGPKFLDPDLTGYATPYSLSFAFGDDLPAAGDVRLFLTGWVEYPYSRLNFAAFQGGRRLQPPTFRWRRSADETWQLFHEAVGYPAGMPKTMVLDVSSVVKEGAREFRIETNMEIYWDQIFAAPVLPPDTGNVTEHEISLQSAVLRFGGYPREYSDDGALPNTYHYDERDPYIPYKAMRGAITREGEVKPLVDRVDDLFVIMGGGDELLLRFSAGNPGQKSPDGRIRTFLLDTHGYCKDMDPLTAASSAVEPLPFAAMIRYPPPPEAAEPERSAYRREWNTRKD